ncbi:transglycosylase SLT domain-containing protein [Rubrivirga sp. S365]|uniref:Transglycosylase SLT domain-containing protein n=1 Tax=Rubrivirga litoralis TaxID=3075598 RepID=A0ABU3BT81_9BACT|nr:MULTISPECIES: transglycosylase SLT domain-containing protein [unclassified Rubrivirga]MDT0632492.1 transglycosylase SLT domain-containing protein [Rubrivirga sp. F394]MDT7857992.1 transglycosylase SLT domain-containing protein [Rubrivirga sp. S365]
MKLKRSFAVLALLIVGGLVAASVLVTANPSIVVPDPIKRDLGAIIERDTLVALTAYTSTSYFLYRGQPFGFEYELLRDFAEEQDVVFRIEVVPQDSLLYYLNAGRGDIAAGRLIPVEQDTSAFGFTAALYETSAVVVQQEAPLDSAGVAQAAGEETPQQIAEAMDPGDASLQPLTIRARLVRRPADLAGSDVYLPEDHPYADRLVELEDRISGDIEVVEVDTTTESLIRQVAIGNIELTVAQENVAELEEGYYDNLLVTPEIGAPHDVAWAVRDNAPTLERALNEWILANRDTGRWNSLYRKYFVDRRGYRERIETGFLTAETGVLSDYDELLKRYAPTVGWDWRLLGSQMYQESRFKPRAQSWAGAMGLLQIMPGTARDLGLADPYDPEQNVEAAARYLKWLEDEYWVERVPDPEERLKFILASYNAGPGHIFDAQRLAAAEGGDPAVWEDVAYWLLQKSNPAVYNRPEVRNGYARGLEPVHYVSIILERYAHYQQFVDDEDAAPSRDQPDA